MQLWQPVPRLQAVGQGDLVFTQEPPEDRRVWPESRATQLGELVLINVFLSELKEEFDFPPVLASQRI